MGYTTGRRHTEESLREIAKKYNTKTEFQTKDKGAYTTSLNKGERFFNSICEHMISGAYSTPQLICKKIMEELLGLKCLYNTKRIITPYELDVYFEEFKLAIEYNGNGWHESEEVLQRDKIKKQLCAERGITLIHILENSRDYEKDVKAQLISNLPIINLSTNNNFLESDIINIVCSGIFEDILKTRDLNEIKRKVKECSSISEFQKKYISEYNFLRKNKKLELLDEIRTIEKYSDEELLERCKKISDYSEFLRDYSNLYSRCHKKGLLEKATSHMTINKGMYKKYTNEELLKLATKYNFKSHLKINNNPLFNEIKKRKLFNNVTYNPDFVYKYNVTIEKESRLQECFENAKKYDNYEDFRNDEILYKKCVMYKIINKIIDNFPKINIEETIINESKKYKTFKEFSETIWYRRTKNITGLIQKVKKENNWKFFANKEELNYVKDYPEVVEMINSGITAVEISKTIGICNSKIYTIKKEMHEKGILKVAFNIRKKINN
jgi:hypothetical protein